MKMNRKIRCAVIGLGRLGYWHAVNVKTKIQSAELVYICDRNEELAKKVSIELDVPNFTTNPSDIFSNDRIEAVIIASPTSTHFELLKEAAFSNKAVFVEKPLVSNLDEAKEIFAIMKRHNTICQVGFMRRFDPAYAEAKKRILRGDIGKPIYFRGISRDPASPPEEFIKNSGGIFIDMAIHDFDIARYLMESDVEAVSAHGKVLKYPFMSKYQDVDQSLCYLEFESGAVGDVESSRNAHYGYDIRAEVIGTEGTIFIGGLRQHNIQVLTSSGAVHDIVQDFPTRFKDAYYLELEDFFNALLEGYQPKVTVEDGVKAQEIAVAAQESFFKQEKVSLKTSKIL